MGRVKGKVVVLAVGAIIAANVALFFWARDSTPGCFLRKDEIAARWGEAKPQGAYLDLPVDFRAATPTARVALVRSLINDHSLYGKSAAESFGRLGPSDGLSPDPRMPAYRVGDEGWSVVLVIGNVAEKKDVVRDIALAKGLVDSKVCAIDETWSGLRIVVRVADRGR